MAPRAGPPEAPEKPAPGRALESPAARAQALVVAAPALGRGRGGIRTVKSALKGDPGTGPEWTEPLERKYSLQAAARAYRADMHRQVALCRRDATAVLPGQADREAGVQARPMASSGDLATPWPPTDPGT